MWLAALVVDGHEWIPAGVEFGRQGALARIAQLTLQYVSFGEQGLVTDLIGDNDIVLSHYATCVSSARIVTPSAIFE